MAKIVEFKKVYLEYPDTYALEDVEVRAEYDENSLEYATDEAPDYEDVYQEAISRTQKLSLEELQKRLEETQSLHL